MFCHDSLSEVYAIEIVHVYFDKFVDCPFLDAWNGDRLALSDLLCQTYLLIVRWYFDLKGRILIGSFVFQSKSGRGSTGG